MLLTSQAQAQTQAETDNWYFQGLVGKRFLVDSDLTLEGTTSQVDIATDAVPSGSAALGYRFQSFPTPDFNTRVEIQGGASESEPESIEPRGLLATRVGSTDKVLFDADNLHSFYGMANLWVDYGLGDSWLVTAGGGLGAALIRWDRTRLGGTVILDDSDVVLAYQGGLGLGYEIIKDLVISVDYRYFATADPQFNFNGNWSADYGSHDIMFGFRYYLW